jgi:anthranilate synthase component 2
VTAPTTAAPKLLLIDNYDSFTYNLVHYFEELGAEVVVARNDALTVAAALELARDGLVLSPGPCTPNEAGIMLDLIAAAPDDLPILGVCLGHQAIGQAHGGVVLGAKAIMHGKTSVLHHDGHGLFEGLPPRFEVARYHSLAVEKTSLPNSLIVDAWTDDGEIMALRHAAKPVFGVQFHPESIASEHGHDILRRFLALARAARSGASR